MCQLHLIGGDSARHCVEKLGLTLQESVHDQLVMFAMDLRGVIRGTWASYL